MKKIILLLLAFMTFKSAYEQAMSNETNKKYTKTMMLGETIKLNPLSDSYIRSTEYTTMGNGTYISDNSAFTIIKESASDYSSGYETYYKYSLTALKKGVYTFTCAVSSTKGLVLVLYTINVVELTGVSIPSKLTLNKGDTYKFSPIITQTGATTTFTWSSSDFSVVSVNKSGEIIATEVGTSIITCTTHNGISAICNVTVNPILTNQITINKTETELVVGEKLKLLASIAPENATNKNITWSSSNENIAVVNESGEVTAISSGTCQIKAIANDNSGVSASCIIKVLKNNRLTIHDISLCKGGNGTMYIKLTDEDVISGFQFDLLLPNGISIAKDNEKFLASLSEKANYHTISINKISDNLYRFVVVSLTGETISQDIENIISITLNATNDITIGEYEAIIKNISMTIKKGYELNEIHPNENSSILVITDIIPGDVNGDSKISVTDVISIISYVLENETTKFILPAADINSDGKVTVTDAINVIDIILNNK